MLQLAARWTPDALAQTLGEALELAAWEGREAALGDGENEAAPTPPTFAASPGRLVFREQIEFLRNKLPTPSRHWRELLHNDHDRAFVVSGVTDMAMLEDIQAALITAAEEGQSLPDFIKAAEGRDWGFSRERLRTIFETNLRSSFMAGRLRQMRDPDVVGDRPYWQYQHGVSRTPMQPRRDHLSWHGLVLRWDDPWWDIHFPPNGWMCSCGVRSLSRRSLERMGKSGPDRAPDDVLIPAIDRTSKQMVMRRRGVDDGWDYMPGDHWARGLTPQQLVAEAGRLLPEGRQRVEIDTPAPIEELIARARPFAAGPLAPGLAAEDYVRAFLRPFGADIGRPVLWQDVTGLRVPVSADYFRDRWGGWKVTKRGRELYTPLMAETLLDPDEIWLGVVTQPQADGREALQIDRRYIRVSPELGVLVVMQLGRRWWEPVTAYLPQDRKGRPDLEAIRNRRGGKLLWWRK